MRPYHRPPGPAGSANVIYSEWANSGHSIRDTTIDATLYSISHFVAPSLTQERLDKGMLLAYMKIGSLGPYALPYTSYAGSRPNTVQPAFKLNKIFVLRNNLDQNVESGHIHLSPLILYRYVIIPGAVSGGRLSGGPAAGKSLEELKQMNYETIARLFDIPEEGSRLK